MVEREIEKFLLEMFGRLSFIKFEVILKRIGKFFYLIIVNGSVYKSIKEVSV